MKKILNLTLTFLALISAIALADSNSATGPTRVACVGDSITSGNGSNNPYPAQLQGILGEKWLVKNFGVSGRTLLKKGDFPYGKEKAFQDAQDFQPNAVIIMLGTNDTKSQNWAHHEDFYADYKDLVETFKNLDSKPKIFICRPCPVFGTGNYGINEANLDLEMPILDQLANDEGASILDMHAALDGKDSLVPDRVHPNAEGDTLLAQAAAHALTGKTP